MRCEIKMARKEKELYVYTVSIKCVGTEEDYMNFLRAVAQEYLTENIILAEDELHENTA